MICYASVDRIEGNIAVLEIELADIRKSKDCDLSEKETVMVDVVLDVIDNIIGHVEEGDILVINYIDNGIDWIYGKDDIEKQRRIDIVKMLYKNI